MIKILLIGSGAREHAIAKAIKKSKQPNQLFCFATGNNPGIMELSREYSVGDLAEIKDIARFAVQHSIDFAVIGPETPLALGVVDELAKYNMSAVGPNKQLAQIETSKGFARDLLVKYQIPASPKYKKFNGLDGVTDFLGELGDDFVIKPDGLTGGKGVKLSGEHLFSYLDALAYCRELQFAGQDFVIEEKLVGQEFSLLSFSDGGHLTHMPAVQDHKRAYENDSGPNTGGMGSYSDSNHLLPFLNINDIRQAQTYNQAIISALHKEFGQPYKGILYGGFMLTKNGVKLIEYNARFGDPEAMNILPLLETDFITVCRAIIQGKLDKTEVNFANKATVCKYAVPEGYPEHPVKDEEIDITKITDKSQLYYSAVNFKNDKLYETGSRTLAAVGIADNILAAEKIAEAVVSNIEGPLFHRKDIGTAKLINKRIRQINKLRRTHYKELTE